MSERGVFAVDRGIFDNPRFAPEPFTEREAFQWMVSEAAWKPRRLRVGSVVVDLRRGQLAHSIRWMAKEWKWTEARVRRFIQRQKSDTAKSDASIDAATDAGVTVITIRNYDKYQRVSLPSDAPSDAPNDAAATQQRRKEKDIKDIEVDDDAGADPPAWQRTPQYHAAKQIAAMCGYAEGFAFDGWNGATAIVGRWLANGWRVDQVLDSVRDQLAKRKERGPPRFVSYFEPGIADFIAEQNRPIPVSELPRGAYEIASKPGAGAVAKHIVSEFNRELEARGVDSGAYQPTHRRVQTG